MVAFLHSVGLFFVLSLSDSVVNHDVNAESGASIHECLGGEHEHRVRDFTHRWLNESSDAQSCASKQHEHCAEDAPTVRPAPMPLPVRAGSRYSAFNVFLAIHVH